MSSYAYTGRALCVRLRGLPYRRLIPRKLAAFYSRHPQLVQSALIGGGLMLLGFGLLYVGVSQLHLGKVRTNFALAPPMNLLGWYLNRRFIWKHRQTLAEEDLSRWAVKWAVSGAVSQGGYILLVSVCGLPYQAARWSLNLTLGPLSYVASKFWIFTHKGFRLAGAARKTWAFGRRAMHSFGTSRA